MAQAVPSLYLLRLQLVRLFFLAGMFSLLKGKNNKLRRMFSFLGVSTLHSGGVSEQGFLSLELKKAGREDHPMIWTRQLK